MLLYYYEEEGMAKRAVGHMTILGSRDSNAYGHCQQAALLLAGTEERENCVQRALEGCDSFSEVTR
jgi:hypothetical protein